MKEVYKLASLRFNFDGERKNGKTQNSRRMQHPFFPYPARYQSRSFAPCFYPPQRVNYTPEKEQSTKQDISVTYDIPELSETELNTPEMNEKVNKTIETDFQAEKSNMKESEDTEDTKYTKYTEEQTEAKPKSNQEKEQEVNVSEKLIAFLDGSEVNLNKAKGHVNNIRFAFEEMTYKLESFTSILEIIHNNEERRMKGPQATLSNQKTTKDTLDEILEVLQNPAFQSILRQFMTSFIGKNQKASKPES